MADTGPVHTDAAWRHRDRPSSAADAMRSRATTTGGLFATAGAAWLLVIFWQGSRLSTGLTYKVVLGTGAAYALAVTCLLLAAVIAPPRPLTYLTAVGAVLGAAAVLGTFATAVLTVLHDRNENVWVYVRQESVLHDLRHSCPGLLHPFRARLDVEDMGRSVVHVHVTCQATATTFVLPADDVFVVTP